MVLCSLQSRHPNLKSPTVSGGDDGSIRVWNLNTRRCEAVLEGHVSAVRGFDFTSDGRYLVSAGRDNVINIWNITSKKMVRTIPTYESLECAGPQLPILQRVLMVMMMLIRHGSNNNDKLIIYWEANMELSGWGFSTLAVKALAKLKSKLKARLRRYPLCPKRPAFIADNK